MDTHVSLDDISGLYARYCRLLDDGDGDGWAGLFTSDGVFRGPGREDINGREALREFVSSQDAGSVKHLTGNVTILDRSNAARTLAGADFVVIGVRPNAKCGRITAMGRYTDWVVRDAEGARFAARTVTRVI